jgi:hypothetical protein
MIIIQYARLASASPKGSFGQAERNRRGMLYTQAAASVQTQKYYGTVHHAIRFNRSTTQRQCY